MTESTLCGNVLKTYKKEQENQTEHCEFVERKMGEIFYHTIIFFTLQFLRKFQSDENYLKGYRTVNVSNEFERAASSEKEKMYEDFSRNVTEDRTLKSSGSYTGL